MGCSPTLERAGGQSWLAAANLTTGWWKAGWGTLQELQENTTFDYDDQGRRQFAGRVDNYWFDSNSTESYAYGNYGPTNFTYNATATVEDYDGAGAVRAYEATENTTTGNTGSLSTLADEYIRGSDWGGGIGGILYSLPASGNATTAKYYHYDGRGDVVAQTGNTGNVTYAAEYNAFGTHATNITSNVTVSGTQEVGTDTDPFRTNTREEFVDADGNGWVNEGHRPRDLNTDTYWSKDPAIMKQVTGDNYWIINGEKVPEEPTSAAELTYRAMLAMRDGHALAATATPSGSGQDVKVGQDAQFKKIDNAVDGAAFESTIHIVHVGNPNWYTYVNANPWTAVDPDGQDALLLNDSKGASGYGHNATIVGNDKDGWTYYSKGGPSGSSNGGTAAGNARLQFATLKDFEKSDVAKRYDHQAYVATTPEQDAKMKAYGDKYYDRPYAFCEKPNAVPEKIEENCADLSADILNAGSVTTDKPKTTVTGIGTLTWPNAQINEFVHDHPLPKSQLPVTTGQNNQSQ